MLLILSFQHGPFLSGEADVYPLKSRTIFRVKLYITKHSFLSTNNNLVTNIVVSQESCLRRPILRHKYDREGSHTCLNGLMGRKLLSPNKHSLAVQ